MNGQHQPNPGSDPPPGRRHLVGIGATTHPTRQAPRTCRCGAQMEPTLDLHRRWTFTDDTDPPRQRIDDYTALSWSCPRCGRRLDATICWSEPPNAPIALVPALATDDHDTVTIIAGW
jgi:hypothetical protein